MRANKEMKTVFTTECEGVPEGATHFRNVGRSTKFYMADGFPVYLWVDGAWVECNDHDLRISTLKQVETASTTKKLFQFTGAPKKMLRHSIVGMINGVTDYIINAYEDHDGRPIWVLFGNEVTRNERIAESRAAEVVALSDANQRRSRKLAAKQRARRGNTVITRTRCDDHSMTIEAC